MSTRISLLPTSAESRRETSTLRWAARAARLSAARATRAAAKGAARTPWLQAAPEHPDGLHRPPRGAEGEGCPSCAAPRRRRILRQILRPVHPAAAHRVALATMPSACTIDVNAGSDKALKDQLMLISRMPIDLVYRIIASRPYTSLEHMKSVVERCDSRGITRPIARRLRFGTPRGAAVGKRRARVEPASSSSAMRKHRAKTKTPPPPPARVPRQTARHHSAHTCATVPSQVGIILDMDIADID